MKQCYQIVTHNTRTGEIRPFFQVYRKKLSAKKALVEYIASHFAYGRFIEDSVYEIDEYRVLEIRAYRFIEE